MRLLLAAPCAKLMAAATASTAIRIGFVTQLLRSETKVAGSLTLAWELGFENPAGFWLRFLAQFLLGFRLWF